MSLHSMFNIEYVEYTQDYPCTLCTTVHMQYIQCCSSCSVQQTLSIYSTSNNILQYKQHCTPVHYIQQCIYANTIVHVQHIQHLQHFLCGIHTTVLFMYSTYINVVYVRSIHHCPCTCIVNTKLLIYKQVYVHTTLSKYSAYNFAVHAQKIQHCDQCTVHTRLPMYSTYNIAVHVHDM